MRVLHILGELRPSGAEVMLRAAAPLWARAGVRGSILATGDAPGAYAPALAQAGYQVHHLPFSRRAGFLAAVRRHLRGGRYDVVHIHTERASFWYAVLARMAGVPRVVRTVHSLFPYPGRLRYARAGQRAAARLLGTRYVSISPAVAATEKSRLFNPTAVIPNWYDDGRFVPPAPGARGDARRALSIGPGEFVLVTVGNCSGIKNHGAVIEALALLPEPRPLYLHVGEEEPGGGERRLAGSLGVGGRVRFMGYQADVAPLLHAADLFVMPSRWEGFGNAAVEAMGAGVPVLFSDVPGLRAFRSLPAPVAYAGTDPASLAASIRTFMEMPEGGRLETGARLSAAVRARFGVRAGAEAYLALYGAAKVSETGTCPESRVLAGADG